MLPNPIIELGPIKVYMYGVMIAVGVFCAFSVIYFYSKRLGIPTKNADFVFYNGIATIAFGFFSAALFQSVYDYIEDPSKGFHFGQRITFIGGLIGGAVFFLAVYFILRNKLKIRLAPMLPVIPCAITIGHALGRVGCFFAGCCYGKPYDGIFSVKFPNIAERVHPTQLYEAVFLLLLFGVLSFLLLKKYKAYKYNLEIYLVAYGIARFVIEFFRGDDRGSVGISISPSQMTSILLIVAGSALLFFHIKFRNVFEITPTAVEAAKEEENK